MDSETVARRKGPDADKHSEKAQSLKTAHPNVQVPKGYRRLPFLWVRSPIARLLVSLLIRVSLDVAVAKTLERGRNSPCYVWWQGTRRSRLYVSLSCLSQLR